MFVALAVQITVLTLSPGSDLFARFGHTAVLVERDQKSEVYNFGKFDPSQPGFVGQFWNNEIPYWVGKEDWSRFSRRYGARLITGQVLNLDDQEAARVADRLDWSIKPENAYYPYDWFRNNCTTKVRDVIDGAVGGDLARTARAESLPTTIRETLQRSTSEVPSFFRALSLSLNERVDQPITPFEAMNMPVLLMEGLRTARHHNEALVKREWTKDGPLPHAQPEPSWIFPLLMALILGALFWGSIAQTGVAQVVSGSALFFYGLVGGVLGLVLVGWSLTGYTDTHFSANLAAFNPLLFALIPVGIAQARHRSSTRAKSVARRVCEVLFVATAFELVAHLAFHGRQVHLAFSFFALIALALSRLSLAGERISRPRPYVAP